MVPDDEIQNALVAIHSRLGTIEGRVTLIARAEQEALLAALEKLVLKKPLVGQIYLLLDGKRTQRNVFEKLKEAGVSTSEMTVSRRMGEMETDHGIAELVQGGAGRIFRKGTETETVLNLSKNVRDWLQKAGEVVPVQPSRRRKRKP